MSIPYKEAPAADAWFCFVEVPLLDRVEDSLELVDEVVALFSVAFEPRAERAEQSDYKSLSSK